LTIDSALNFTIYADSKSDIINNERNFASQRNSSENNFNIKLMECVEEDTLVDEGISIISDSSSYLDSDNISEFSDFDEESLFC
jgi:hypothetical protein